MTETDSASRSVASSSTGGFQKPDSSGWKLSDLVLKETLGTGTFGRVRLCQHKDSGEFYAMKILKKAEVVRMRQVEHILSEKAVLEEICHPFIVNLMCTFSNETRLYMVLDYIPGGELFSHLRKALKFPSDVSKFYAAEIVLAFEYLHSLDIVYRDLKPENLLLDARGHIRITDFGFAKRVVDRTFTLCGTPEYLAPEIIQSRGHGKAVDWWALGILIFEMMVGYPPFFDESPFRIYEKILEGRLAFPRWVDSRAKDLVKGLLTTDATRRVGNLRRGVQDVKKHKWFSGVDWDLLLARRIPAPIPIRIGSSGDSRYYDSYPDSTGDAAAPLTPQQQELFKDW
eukprot:TRINITY_DN184_c0_g1_i1.p1 TRINITY_DN184_c0_g1~~TRINITY_DN184_c0_g1_i1.p1  ORF type:complete len:342 (-),score=73.22 TRINITY_DN184_c0_g1_i1:834-1859(-)